jgi:hypothetical protein
MWAYGPENFAGAWLPTPEELAEVEQAPACPARLIRPAPLRDRRGIEKSVGA